jgi:predicted dehydrogenase
MKTQQQTKIQVALIGLGKIGCRYDLGSKTHVLTHASAISANDAFELVAAVEIIPGYVDDFKKHYSAPVFTSINEMLDAFKPQLIVIATPTNTHVKILEQILGSPKLKAVLCEKPISEDVYQATRIVKQFEELKIDLVLNYQRRSAQPTIELKRLISGKHLGAFLGGSAFYSGGYFNSASHLVDLLEWVFEATALPSKLTQLTKLESDFGVNATFKLMDKDFHLQQIETDLFSIFEAQLHFEKFRVRYLDGGNRVFIDELQTNKIYPSEYSYGLSENPKFTSEGNDLIQVYKDLLRLLQGQSCNLLPGADAISLVRRMYSIAEMRE